MEGAGHGRMITARILFNSQDSWSQTLRAILSWPLKNRIMVGPKRGFQAVE